MKPMIISDLRIMSTNSVWVIPLFVILSVICSMGAENVYMAPSMMFAMFAISYAISAPVSDTQNNWALGRIALPLSRKQIVMGRYTTGVIICLAGFILSAIAGALTVAAVNAFGVNAAGADDPDLIIAQIGAMLLCASFMLIVLAVTYPVTFAIEAKSAVRVIPAIAIVIFMAIAFLLSYIGENVTWLDSLMSSSILAAGGVSFLLSAVIYGISVIPALSLYKKREL